MPPKRNRAAANAASAQSEPTNTASAKRKQTKIAAASAMNDNEHEEPIDDEAKDAKPKSTRKGKAVAAPAAAASASPSSNAANSLHPDHLSLVFRFLNCADFVSALSVSRSWAAAAQLKTAWAEFDCAKLTESMMRGSGLDAGTRRVNVDNAAMCSTLMQPLRLSQLLASRTWAQAQDVSLPKFLSKGGEQASACLQGLAAKCTSLRGLQLDQHRWSAGMVTGGAAPSKEALTSFVQAVGSRLWSLHVHVILPDLMGPLLAQLSELRMLSVLSVNIPSLLSLHKLELLSVQCVPMTTELLMAIRSLSVNHALRSLKHEQGPFGPTLDLSALITPSDDGLDPARLTAMTFVDKLEASHVRVLFSMPHLRFLNLHGQPAPAHLLATVLSAPDFPVSTSLRTLLVANEVASCELMLAVATKAPNLEAFERSIGFVETIRGAGPLPSMQHLRVLSINGDSLANAHLNALAALPRFERLTLTRRGQDAARLKPADLKTMMLSNTWRTLEWDSAPDSWPGVSQAYTIMPEDEPRAMQIRVRLVDRTFLMQQCYALVRTSGTTFKFKMLC